MDHESQNTSEKIIAEVFKSGSKTSLQAEITESSKKIIKKNRASTRAKPLKIIFYSALNQWTVGLEKIIENSGFVFKENQKLYYNEEKKCYIKIHNWENMHMSQIDEIVEEKNENTVLKPIHTQRKYPIEDWLYIFVAPLPLAAKFRHDHHLCILGPAFSTNSDISIYVRQDFNCIKSSNLKIGVVQDDITSTIMLFIFLGMVDNLFHPNPISQKLKMENINEKYEYIAIKGFRKRLSDMNINGTPEDDLLDASIFTNNEYKTLLKEPQYNNIPRRQIINLDVPVSHYLGLADVPRAVYFTHKTQTVTKHHELSFFLHMLEGAIPLTLEQDISGGMKPIFPWDLVYREAQRNLMRASTELGITKYIRGLQFVEYDIANKIIEIE